MPISSPLVLVVEDDSAIAEVLQAYLLRAGCRVVRAADGETALQLARSLRPEVIDKLTALRIGADDYVTKPFNPNEVIARVSAVLRRSAASRTRVVRMSALVLDPDARRVTTASGPLALTPSEYRLL